jgi:hypothetical protein
VSTNGSPPLTELGRTSEQLSSTRMWGQPWTYFIDEKEYVPELTWPGSIRVFDQMRTDTQLSGLLSGCVLPILAYRWMIDPNDARTEIVEGVAKDLNLPIKDEEDAPKGRMKRRFSWGKHARQAFLSLIYGHMYFEQVGEIGDDNLWHLRKLAPRMPRTISEFKIADDGGLISIVQGNVALSFNQIDRIPEVPVDRLVGYIWEQEGASWVGRSMLRDCYKNWLVKDRLIRVDAINHERAGGVPYGIAAPGSTADEVRALNELMSEFKVGEMSGAAVPAGTEVHIAKGSGSHVVESMRYHDELMARKFLLMLMQLGQTQTGSRALSSTFLDFFTQGQEFIANWLRDTVNEYVIEDWVDWNYGEEEEQVPLLMYEPIEDRALAIQDLAELVEKRIVIVDEALEDTIRYRYGLPKRVGPRPSDPMEQLIDGGGGGPGAPSLPLPAAENE